MIIAFDLEEEQQKSIQREMGELLKVKNPDFLP